MFSSTDKNNLLIYSNFAQNCADMAREIIDKYFRHTIKADDKKDDSPVTIADKTIETIIRHEIRKNFPHHAIIGEEDGHEGELESEWLWVIDPIDGTRAFITGRPTFCTLISLFHNGAPVLGLIDQPITKERWIGIKTMPTSYQSPLTGRAMTSQKKMIIEAEMSCTSPEIIRVSHQKKFNTLIDHVKRVSWGGDAYAYGLLSLGMIDVIAEDTLKLWDWAALIPIIEGAGGVITDWYGAPLNFKSDGSILATANRDLHAQALALLK